MAEAETYTYKLTLGYETPYVGCDDKNTVQLKEYGYSDQEWDGLNGYDQDDLLDEWATENFRNSGFGAWGEVNRG